MIKQMNGESLETYAWRLKKTSEDYWAVLLRLYHNKEQTRDVGLLVDEYAAELNRVLTEMDKEKDCTQDYRPIYVPPQK